MHIINLLTEDICMIIYLNLHLYYLKIFNHLNYRNFKTLIIINFQKFIESI